MRALVVKAVAGAGFDHGIAERWAGATHASPKGLAALARALDTPGLSPFLRDAPALADLETCGLAARWPDGTDRTLKTALLEPIETPGPVEIDRVTIETLKRHADRTLVPVGADSHANAGAGLNDND